MFWLRRMRAFLSRPGAVSVWLASCAYGSEFLKEFRFVGCWIRADALHRKCACPRGWRHTPVQGQNAKRSAMYCRGSAQALARQFRDAVLDRTSSSEKQSGGLESLSANDVLLSAPWKVGRSWRWGQKRHINVLEAEATVSVLRDAALSGGDKRFCIATDSAVAKGALAKGRSSALLLAPFIRRAAAIQAAFGLYPALVYSPSRLNPSDDPTRDRSLRASARTSLFSCLTPEDGPLLCSFQKLDKFTAAWIRLAAPLLRRLVRGTLCRS